MKNFEPRPESTNLPITNWMPLVPHEVDAHAHSHDASEASSAIETGDTHANGASHSTGEYSVIYKMQSLPHGALWLVSCNEAQGKSRGLAPGEYTLHSSEPQSDTLKIRSLERLLNLDNPESVATLLTHRESDHRHEKWYEPLGAGSLDNVLSVRSTLTPGEVTYLAESVAAALTWVHQQSFAYSELRPHTVAFTLDEMKPKLLAPDIDFRGAPATIATQHKAHDIREFSALIWRALTGVIPEDTITRKPLSLYCPDAPDSLAQVLELALDAPADAQPQLAEITAALASYAKPTPIELHTAAHPSVKGRLPARIVAPATSHGVSRASRTTATPKTRQKKATGITTSKSRPRWLLPVAAAVGVLAVCAAGRTLVNGSEEPQQSAATVTSEPSVQQVAETPAESHPSSSASATSDSIESITADAEHLEEDIHSIFEARNKVLASGNGNGIVEYAVLTSDVARADGELISRDSDRTLASQPLSVVEITEISTDAEHAQATVTLRSNQTQLAGTSGITEVNGGAQQRARLTLALQDHQWKLETAVPISD